MCPSPSSLPSSPIDVEPISESKTITDLNAQTSHQASTTTLTQGDVTRTMAEEVTFETTKPDRHLIQYE